MGFTERPPVKPLIAAVEGYALAGGTELALATDLIVASKDSAFGIPEVKRGLVAGGGGLLRLPQRIPSAIAMELALTGENLSAERAHALGMVNVLAEPGSALDAAIELAEKIAANGRWRWPPPSRSSSSPAAGAPRPCSPSRTSCSPRCSPPTTPRRARSPAEKRPPKWTGT